MGIIVSDVPAQKIRAIFRLKLCQRVFVHSHQMRSCPLEKCRVNDPRKLLKVLHRTVLDDEDLVRVRAAIPYNYVL